MRLNFVYGFIGVNRTGKSVKAESIARAWKESRPKGTIVSYDPQRRFKHLSDYEIDPEDKKWPLKCLKLRNALLILDDVREINEQNTPLEGLRTLLSRRADHNLDIIYIVHNPSLILNALSSFTTKYFVFLTYAQEGSFQKKIPSYVLCQTASNYVNDYVAKHGRGTYPNFPYIVVDIEKNKLQAYNMNPIKL